MRLNLGAGDVLVPGFRSLDRKLGDEVYPLRYADGSVDEIRASHVLEHFSHREAADVLKHWVSKLKYGGRIRIAVPDFEQIAQGYLEGAEGPWQSYVMGGHVDEDDRHGCLFDAEALTEIMRAAGLTNIKRWQSEVADCASLPISLNLEGEKQFRVAGLMSVPRLGFMDNYFCAWQAAVPLGVTMETVQGAFWDQCLERGLDIILDRGNPPDAILTIDYDTVWKREQLAELIRLMATNPEIDALAPLQAMRGMNSPLFTIAGPDGKSLTEISRETLDPDLVPLRTAHFGLTLIRTKSLVDLPRPWFKGEPNEAGRWGDNRVDPDMWFWQQWRETGRKLFLAPRVVVGHLELVVRWPDQNLQPFFQETKEFHADGIPEKTWK